MIEEEGEMGHAMKKYMGLTYISGRYTPYPSGGFV